MKTLVDIQNAQKQKTEHERLLKTAPNNISQRIEKQQADAVSKVAHTIPAITYDVLHEEISKLEERFFIELAASRDEIAELKLEIASLKERFDA